jgi:hypothetical protein
MARGVSCDLDRGREYQDKYLEEIVRSGGLLSIKAEPFPYVEVESPIATTFANPTGVTQGFSLYLFERCSFEQSLSLVELFSFTPRRTEKGRVIPFGSREIDWANDEVRERTLKSVFQLLRALRQQHQIVISEYLEGVIQVRKIDADDGSWSDAVKHVLEFHRNVLMSRFGKEELAEYRRYFVKNRTFFLG